MTKNQERYLELNKLQGQLIKAQRKLKYYQEVVDQLTNAREQLIQDLFDDREEDQVAFERENSLSKD